MVLTDAHIAHLRTSALTDETMRACQFESVEPSATSEARVAKLLGWKGPPPKKSALGAGILIPYLRTDGRPPQSWTFRPDIARAMKEGQKPSKYIRTKPPVTAGEKGATPPYFPANAHDALRSQSCDHVVIVEGEKKAALVAQLGFASIGIAGVHNAHDASNEARWTLNQEISEHVKGRRVTVLFDADAHTNASVMNAASVLAAMLLDAGVIAVRFTTPPPTESGPKGIDDFCFVQGADAARAIISNAGTIEPASLERGKRPWRNRLSCNDEGKLLRTVSNARLFLAEHERLSGCLGFDERRVQSYWLKDPPWKDGTAKAGLPIKDAHIVELASWLGETEDFDISTTMAAEVLSAVAQKRSADPARVYLEGLQWDGSPRLDRWLVDCADIDAPDGESRQRFNDYVNAVGARWLISAVARTFEPGCKADHVLVLEGPQGIGKSSLFSALVPSRSLFTDHLPDLREKDARLAVHGPWIVEMAELAALPRGEMGHVKSFLTTQVDNFRPPYGKFNADHPRRCVFAGTVNPDGAGWLTDATGARRFWPVPVRAVFPERLVSMRDQLWAEAVVRYQKKEPWWPSAGDAISRHVAEEHEARFVTDPWEERLADKLLGIHETTVPCVLEQLMGTDGSMRAGRSEQMRVAQALKRMGWARQQRGTGAKRGWVYTRSQTPTTPTFADKTPTPLVSARASENKAISSRHQPHQPLLQNTERESAHEEHTARIPSMAKVGDVGEVGVVGVSEGVAGCQSETTSNVDWSAPLRVTHPQFARPAEPGDRPLTRAVYMNADARIEGAITFTRRETSRLAYAMGARTAFGTDFVRWVRTKEARDERVPFEFPREHPQAFDLAAVLAHFGLSVVVGEDRRVGMVA